MLREDVARRGLLVPLEINRDRVVVDGHLRLQVAIELDLDTVPAVVVEPADEVEYLVLAAIRRRQLEPGQRAALALELEQYRLTRASASSRSLANLQHQRAEVATLPPQGKTRDLVAGWAGVSARTAQDAITVHTNDPELFE